MRWPGQAADLENCERERGREREREREGEREAQRHAHRPPPQ